MIAWHLRVMVARKRVPSPRPRFSRYVHHSTWHVCPYQLRIPFDSDQWIEVTW